MESSTKSNKRTRQAPAIRKENLLKAALKLAKEQGLSSVNHQNIAKVAKVSTATAFNYFENRIILDKTVAQYIIQNERPSLLRLEAEITLLRRITDNQNDLEEIEQSIPAERLSLSEYIHAHSTQTETV
ncbi:MAG: hypothetical protein CENE_02627 [Candidatus Celerinatantimonas neptuna]|nr:MAG: hypothetical protein CENE_02627 [Candidatus Celerinatantimonas neptuna]